MPDRTDLISSELKSGTFTRSAVSLIIFAALCGLAAYVAPSGPADAQEVVWFSVVPPILAIVLAFLTRHVVLSLGIAILAGGLT
jgi:hypothetical protein